MAVILETVLGDLTVDLLTEERPRACLNFLKLCKQKYYNMCLFHTVQRNQMVQCGDPTGTGKGGHSVFRDIYGEQAAFFEAETKPRIKHTKRGQVSMVNDGNGQHGSQFFITLADELDYLDQQGHTVFGEVTEGEEILDKMNELYCDKEGKPFQNVRIFHTVILDDPFDDPPGLEIPENSPEPDRSAFETDRLEYDEDIDPYKDKTEEEVQEIEAEKAAKANAQILEMIGDLPDQEVAPPDNVLFVCKLNPVTSDDDLETIFSRFGEIKSCEVIRDSKTKESLQYAFVEFEDPEHCANAYFKMDNVLIDDRRIHVDFSQSVSKLQWKGKGKGVSVDGKGGANNKLYGLDFDTFGSRNKNSERTKQEDRRGRDGKYHTKIQSKNRSQGRSRSRDRRDQYRSHRSPDRSTKYGRRSRSTERTKGHGPRSPERSRGRRSRSPMRSHGRRPRSRDRHRRSSSQEHSRRH